MEKERVLVVDDEAVVRKLLYQKLSGEGYLCVEADSAERALDSLRSRPTELVVLDILMPGKSGIEFLPEIKTSYPDTAVIMASAVTDVAVATQCMKQGADDYICKPFNIGEVSLDVARALEKRRLQLKIKEYQRHLEGKVHQQTCEKEELFYSALKALVIALEAKDKYTAGHSRRVALTAVAIGEELGLSANDLEDLRWGSLLHDVGKTVIDQSILNKPGSLTPEEYEEIMAHADVGASIVKPVVNDRLVEMIKHHHDYYDGSRFDQLVCGKEMPLAARILAVADSFDAMISCRPYRSAMSRAGALDEIKRRSGSQFDPVVASAFLKMQGTSGMNQSLKE